MPPWLCIESMRKIGTGLDAPIQRPRIDSSPRPRMGAQIADQNVSIRTTNFGLGLADEGNAHGDRPLKSGRKIVEHDDALAGREERVEHVAADVAGAAGDQNRHLCCPLLVVCPIPTRSR
jgi:hypothetical protein